MNEMKKGTMRAIIFVLVLVVAGVFAGIMITNISYSERRAFGVVIESDADKTIVETRDGNRWLLLSHELKGGDVVLMVFRTRGTERVEDDMVCWYRVLRSQVTTKGGETLWY